MEQTIFGSKAAETAYLHHLQAELEHAEHQLCLRQDELSIAQAKAVKAQIWRNEVTQRYYNYKKDKGL